MSGRLESAELGDIRDLSRFPEADFDAVLCLGGPLSHIVDGSEREQAMSELVRVTGLGAPLFLSVMGYYAVLRTVLSRFSTHLVAAEHQDFLRTGTHAHQEGGFCDCHFFVPDELQGLAERAGLETVELRACEGLSSNLPGATNDLAEHDDGRWERWLEIIDRTCHDRAVVAASEHLLYVGRRRKRE